jgi:hypothetical protein
VFELETDPNILLTPSPSLTQVWFQWANVGGARGSNLPSCESKTFSQSLQYDVYVQYVTENDDSGQTLFDVMRSMSVDENQLKMNSQLVSRSLSSSFRF